ncbi:hypothetical protein DOY81_000421 [Sarcophaga bullata]|nr:hypothetical protein DOY81_000421 [Sarcophaga bullata]
MSRLDMRPIRRTSLSRRFSCFSKDNSALGAAAPVAKPLKYHYHRHQHHYCHQLLSAIIGSRHVNVFFCCCYSSSSVAICFVLTIKPELLTFFTLK